MAFNLFGPPTKDDIKVGYIDPSLGYISKVSIDDANYYASNNPGTIFIFVNGNNVIKYLNINEVNKLNPNDLISTDECNGINQKKECGLPTIQFFGGNGIGASANPIIGNDGALLAVDLVSGGNGYEYPPSVVANDICNYGSGATLVSNIGEITEALENNEVVEQYQISKITDIDTDFGRIYGPNGEDLGSWSPDSYIKDNGNLLLPLNPINNSLGKGVVIDVIIRDPGNGYTYTPSADTGYPVLLRLKKVIVEFPGINYSNIDQIEITPSNGAVLQPILGNFGQIIDVKILNPGLGFTEYPKIIMVTPGPGGTGPGGTGPGSIGPGSIGPGSIGPGGIGPGGIGPGGTGPGGTGPGGTGPGGTGPGGIGGSPPGISDGSPTGVNASFLPVFEIVRDPIVPTSLQEKLIQVTDLVGLKQNGYINGRPYYGSVYYNQGVRFTGFYETIGSPIQVYDTLQESINAQIVTPASAIQRSGTDISSNNSRLNIPNTPQNLI